MTGRGAAGLLLMGMTALCVSVQAQAPEPLAAYQVVGDAIPRALANTPGDAARGRAIVTNKQLGLCLLCHTGPFDEEPFQGNIAPDLAGVGSRLTEGQLRLRLVDGRRVNPESIMPAYHRTAGLNRIGPAWQGKPLLAAQQVEDVVAFLLTLRAAR